MKIMKTFRSFNLWFLIISLVSLSLPTGAQEVKTPESKDAAHVKSAAYEWLDVALDLPTFSATAEMAGLSRVMGGYHIQADNIAGLDLGRKVSVYIYPKIKSYFDGTAKIDAPNSKKATDF